MEKILVTGGAGYFGSVLIRHLLKRRYRVTVLDNLLYGQATLVQCCTEPKSRSCAETHATKNLRPARAVLSRLTATRD